MFSCMHALTCENGCMSCSLLYIFVTFWNICVVPFVLIHPYLGSWKIQRVPIPLLQSHSKFQRRKPAIVKSSHTAQLTMERLQSSGFCCMTIYISSPSKLIIEDHRHRAPCHLYHAPHTALIPSTEQCTPPTQCCHWWRRANRVTALPMATCHCRENQNNVKFLVGTMQTGFLPWGAFVSWDFARIAYSRLILHWE